MFKLRIHFPSGESLAYMDVTKSQLIDTRTTIGFKDKTGEAIFNKDVIAGYAITHNKR